MKSAYIYLQIYKLFDRSTPLPIDCGKYCGGACCKGDDESGMYLFPGEKEVFRLIKPEGFTVLESSFEYDFNGGRRKTPILICSGSCDRTFRPLACRIFPLTPVLDDENNIRIITDPRAKGICPLANTFDIDEYSPGFVNAVQKAFMLLKKNQHVLAFLKEYTKYIDRHSKFFN